MTAPPTGPPGPLSTAPPVPPGSVPPVPPGPPDLAPPIPPGAASQPPLPPPPPRGPSPLRKNSATAHLCAAAYLDRDFRDRVIDEVYSRPDRAIAPNQGTDAVPVLRHVLQARTLDVAQQSILASLLLLLVCMPLVSWPGLLIGLGVWWLVGLPFRWSTQGLSTAPNKREREQSRRTRVLLRIGAVAAILLGLYLLQYLLFLYYVGNNILDLNWRSTPDDPYYEATERDQGPDIGGVLLILLILSTVTAAFGLFRALGLTSIPSEREPMAPANGRVAFIGVAQRAPVVNYHAGALPFVGSGYELATWHFAITLVPADSGAEHPAEMTVDSVGLHRHVRERILGLGGDTALTVRLPNLSLTDHVYVSGRDTARPTHYLGELPYSSYPFASIEEVQRNPTTPARHFLRCEVVSWDGELVTTVYLHLALQGRTLYAEFSSCALPPTQDQYHVFGHGSVPKGLTILVGLLNGVASMPVDFVRSPIDTCRNISRALRSAWAGTGSWWGVPEDHGAVASIRELGTDIGEQNEFQYRDAMKFLHIIERQILEAMIEYLRENNVDLSELEERARTIVNNGVINYGKLVTGAAGAGATATVGSVGDHSKGTAKEGPS